MELARKLLNYLKINLMIFFCLIKKLNFNLPNSKLKLQKILKKYNPDIIINASGILGNNYDDYKNL